MKKQSGAPVESKQRHIILDALRGFALLGICLANYPEFSLYSFLESHPKALMPTAGIDTITQWFLYIFIDGKFYTIFSLLFGIGFSIILENNRKRGANGILIFYRRMFFLFLIGLAHLILIWSGDILMLYAAVGMTLPLFLRCKDRTLVIWASIFLGIPVIIDYICQFTGVYLSSRLVEWQWLLCDRFGITQENFAYWLRDAHNYQDMHKFLLMGAVERMQEFVDGNRYFKVLGLFLIGFLLGRNRIFARLEEFKPLLKKISLIGLCIGLPLSAIYAWSAMNSKPFGFGTHSLFYFISVYLTSFGYISLFCLLYLKKKELSFWKVMAYPGRMALTNYIGQSALGVLIFYGVGLGLGADTGLIYGEIIALAVFFFEIAFSSGWLKYFRFGPLEWIWRCLTYFKLFPILITLFLIYPLNIWANDNSELAQRVFNDAKNRLYSNPKEASSLAYRALQLCDTSQPDSLCREATILYGNAEQLLGNFDLSLRILNDAELLTDSTDLHTTARLFELQGRVLSKLGDFTRSAELNDKATSMFRALGDSAMVASCYNERGVMLLNTNNFVLAEHFFNRALDINRKQKNLQAIATNLNNMCLYPGDSEEKLKMIEEAIAINKNLDSKWALGENYNNKGKQQIFAGKYKDALSSLDQAAEYINEIEAKELLCDNYEYMSLAKAGLADYRSAYDYMVKMVSLVSELQRRNNQRNTEIALSRKLHDDLENAAKQKENDYEIRLLHIYLIILIAIVVLLVVGSFIYFKWVRHKKNLQLYETRHELDKQKQEIDSLKLREQQLELENAQNMLTLSRQELTGFAAFLKSRKEMTEKIKEMLKEGYKLPKEDIVAHLKKINAFISSYSTHDTISQSIILKAEERNKSFMEKLMLRHPQLTKGEQNLALLIRGGMSSKEISILLGLEPKTINMNRYRLRKALEISQETDLEEYLSAL